MTLFALLATAFPDWLGFESHCWVRRAMEERPGDWDDAVDVVSRVGEEEALARRLLLEHPSKPPHRLGHDEGVLNAFTEVEAFAWASDVARLGVPTFVTREGAPDVAAPGIWIEAKTVRQSEEERLFRRNVVLPEIQRRGYFMSTGTVAPVSDGFLNKFQSHFENATKKFERQEPGRRILFFCLDAVDTPTMPQHAREAAVEWAEQMDGKNSVEIAICWNHNWTKPFYWRGNSSET